MEELEIFEKVKWHPFSSLGFTSSLLDIDKYPVMYTWATLIAITVLALAARSTLRHPHSIAHHITLKYVRAFVDLVKNSFDGIIYKHFAFITAIFTFILVSNCIVLIPGMEEPTKNINTTLALALISIVYIQYAAIRAHGLIPYLNEYFKTPLPVFSQPIPVGIGAKVLFFISRSIFFVLNIVIALALFPIELLGLFAKILSLAFRLFGNIFGGSVVSMIWANFRSGSMIIQSIAFLSGVNLIIVLFFGLFEGCIQAFVFTILSLTYLSMALRQQHEA
jgi:F-type H+-transporting ATPase subunit a